MPCKKCKDGKYKWGNTGECKYATKDECEKANPKKYSKMKQIPTPLGNKTYEEYEKELKEYNLSKVERVELGMVDDINKIYKDAQKLSAAAEGKGLNDLRKLTLKVENDFLQLSRKAEEGLELIQKAEKQLKELGVAKPKEIQGIENVLKSYENNAEDWIKRLGADQYR